MTSTDGGPTFEQVTRGVFDRHHRVQAANSDLYDRLVSLVSPEYFGLPADHFRARTVLDAGCGSNANASFAFLALGAARVHSADLGEAWMDCARARLEPFAERSVLDAQDVLLLSYPDASFDFVHCAGVLHHTTDPARGFRELARVTRPGGRTFITMMANGDGLLYQGVNLLRRRYAEDEVFRRQVNHLDGATLARFVQWLLDAKDAREPSTSAEREVLLSLVDDDLALTIRDRLEAPTYSDFDFTEAQLRGWFEAAGYVNVRRLTRYTRHFRNARRFLAPLYEQYDHPYAKLLFGEGYVQLIGTKA
jgi:ubiquinone/menaquinone biosynthesis C-methylase UbiE